MSESEDLNQNNRQTESVFIEDENSHLYLSRSFLLKRDKKPKGLLIKLGGKTIWDWLGLLVPVLITLIATLAASSFTYHANKRQQEILIQREKDVEKRNQVDLLLEYLNEITRLIENGDLTAEDSSSAVRAMAIKNESSDTKDVSKTSKTIAKARTLTVLRALDSDRKGQLIQFLSAAELINKNRTIIDLKQADLTKANLSKVILYKENLEEVDLRDANLQDAELVEANLRDAQLQGADLQNAKLQEIDLAGANLSGEKTNLTKGILRNAKLPGAILTNVNFSNVKDLREADFSREADLQKADFSGVNLTRVDFSDSNLSNANLDGTNLQQADFRAATLIGVDVTPEQLKLACNWEQAIMSEKLKQELSSAPDPPIEPNCDLWKR